MTTQRHRVVCVLAHGMTSVGMAIANELTILYTPRINPGALCRLFDVNRDRVAVR